MLKISATALLAITAPTLAQTASAPVDETVDARVWPRHYKANGIEFSLYQPQVDSWSGNRLKARSVIAIRNGDKQDYGVLWLTARTETDKDAREVILTDLSAERVRFPGAAAREADYLAAIRRALPTTRQVVSLDTVEAALAITDAGRDSSDERVSNTPPEIIFSFEPAVLALVDGDPVWRASGVAGVDRILNSRAPILRYQDGYFLGHAGQWASARSLTGPWTDDKHVPSPVTAAAAQIASASNRSDPQAQPLPGGFPEVYVRTRPAELIVVDGQPRFEDIEGTKLSFVSNTPADVFLDSGNNWYVLTSGRWFTAPSTHGPWNYVAANHLPGDFARIPSDSPKGAVLASVAGTPEAQESLIANAVPQTATVDRSEAQFIALYDGVPQFDPISGTGLAAARNSPTPIIRVSDNSYVALDKGVWFTATAPTGPWTVATAVPQAIYTIPTSAPLHYVTYVRIYGYTDSVVYVGYTPGYYGTVASNGVVVYGTGYPCDAWVGTTYYGCPATYGYGAAFAFGALAGWTLAFGYGWYDPWYYPYWGPWYYPGYWGGSYYAFSNVYGHWGSSVVAGTSAAWASSWTGNYGRGYRGGYYNPVTGARGYGYAAHNTNIYTGNRTAVAGAIRYNPQTGRIVAGRGGAASNIYTGEGVAAGARATVNTQTGRVTRSAGAASRTTGGASAAGRASTTGAGGDAAGAGYVHYDRRSGDVSGGGVVDVNGNVYAGKDGNVWRYNKDTGRWESMVGGTTARSKQGPPSPDSSLDRERIARDRGFERDVIGGRGFSPPGTQRPGVDRSEIKRDFKGRMGGFRGIGGRRR